MDRLQIMFLTAFCFVSVIQLLGAQLTNTLSDKEGATVTLECAVSGSYTFPEWRGPPSLTIYTNVGSGTINPTVTKFSYAANDRDLVLSGAEVSHSGVYKCSVAGTGDNTITLTITEATETTTSEPCSWWCILLIVIGGLYLCGIVIGIFMYCCKDEPWDKIYVKDKTYWWIFLLIIVIAGLGILTVYLICKGCGRFNGK